MENNQTKRIITIIVPIVIALVSFFLLAPYFTSSSFLQGYSSYLDEKRNLVLEMTSASAASSVAVTMLPGDIASPIAENLANISSYSLIVLCAIFLEKYLLAITGFISFKVLIPISCGSYLLSLTNWKRKFFTSTARRVAMIAIALFLTIPCSIHASQFIENRYEDSITENIALAQETVEEIQESTEKENNGIIDSIVSSVTDTVDENVSKLQTALTNFIEAVAIMIVTSCIIPLGVLAFFVWLLKILFQFDSLIK